MDSLIGYGFPGYAGGADIIGQGGLVAQPGVPPYGAGFPQGTAFYPVDAGFHPYAAVAQQQAMMARMQQAGTPDAVAGHGGGWGGGGGGGPFGCNVGPLEAPLAVQRNEQPLVGLAPWCYTRSETQFFGFQGCTIPAGGTAFISANPCLLTKIIRWCVPSDIAYSLRIDQITINAKDTLVNNAGIPAAMLIETSTIPDMIATSTIQPGCCIQLQVTNTGDAPVNFSMGCIARVMWR